VCKHSIYTRVHTRVQAQILHALNTSVLDNVCILAVFFLAPPLHDMTVPWAVETGSEDYEQKHKSFIEKDKEYKVTARECSTPPCRDVVAKPCTCTAEICKPHMHSFMRHYIQWDTCDHEMDDSPTQYYLNTPLILCT
jgi:hypothetical protein